MVEISKDQIEIDSIDKLKEFIRKSKKGTFIHQYLAVGDKEVSFDGYLTLYNDSKKEKKHYERKVFVQVKGTNMKNLDPPITLKHDIKIDDLRNYLKEDGVMYIVVALWYDEEQNIIDYKCYGRQLHNALILDYLASGNSRTKRVPMYQLTKKNFYSNCIEFCKHQDKQRNHHEKIKIIGNDNIIISTPEELILNPVNGLPINDFYTYKSVEVEGKTVTFTGEIVNVTGLSIVEHQVIKVLQKKKSMKVEISKFEKETVITFNDALVIKFDNGSDILSIKLNPIINVTEYIDAIWLYENILKNHSVQFGENILTFNSEEKSMKDQMIEFKQNLIELKRNLIKLEVDDFYINSTGDFYLDNDSIKKFNKSIKNKSLSVYNVTQSTIYKVPLAGKSILIYYDNERKKIENIFKDKYVEDIKAHIKIDDNEIPINLPFIFGLNADLIINLINYDHSFMEKHINAIDLIEVEGNDSKVATQFLLELIKAYDETSETRFLSLSKKLLNKLPENNDHVKTIKTVNKSQITIRENVEINSEDLKYLLNQKILAIQNKDYYKALNISVVLQDISESKIYFDELSDDEKVYFKQYPLFYLYTDLINNVDD